MQKRFISKIKIGYKNAEDIFVLFALLNAIGYDDENNDKGMYPMRKRVRKQLSAVDWKEKYPQCKNLLKEYHPGWLLLDALKKRETAKPPKIQKVLEQIKNDLLMRKLWNEYKSDQKRECEEMLPIFKEEISSIVDFIGVMPKNINTLALAINPLDVYWRGYGLAVKETGYIIIGPGNKQQKRNVMRHELMHILAPKIAIPQNILEHPKNKVLAKMGYSTKSVLNREYVVRAVQIAYEVEILKKDLEQALLEEPEFPKIKEAVEFVQMKIKRRPL